LTGGCSTARITASGVESGLSQFFLCLHQSQYEAPLIDEIIHYSKSGLPVKNGQAATYPGENTLQTRLRNQAEGIPVDEKIWNSIRKM
jgi:3-dehydro-L-gulonate 2-dehydrogenase